MTPRDILDAAREDALRHPPAVSGQSGHTTTFLLAVRLVHHWRLSGPEALAILREWNAACLPPWSDRELEHKVSSAVRDGKSGAPAGCLAERVGKRRGGGMGAFMRWKATRPQARTLRTLQTKSAQLGISDASDALPNTLIHIRDTSSSIRKVLREGSEASGGTTGLRLVPLLAPFVDGCRYREAGACEWPGKLDL